jgi:hypothetical protein
MYAHRPQTRVLARHIRRTKDMAFFVHRQELARRTAHDEAMALIDAYLAWQDTAASMKEGDT